MIRKTRRNADNPRKTRRARTWENGAARSRKQGRADRDGSFTRDGRMGMSVMKRKGEAPEERGGERPRSVPRTRSHPVAAAKPEGEEDARSPTNASTIVGDLQTSRKEESRARAKTGGRHRIWAMGYGCSNPSNLAAGRSRGETARRSTCRSQSSDQPGTRPRCERRRGACDDPGDRQRWAAVG